MCRRRRHIPLAPSSVALLFSGVTLIPSRSAGPGLIETARVGSPREAARSDLLAAPTSAARRNAVAGLTGHDSRRQSAGMAASKLRVRWPAARLPLAAALSNQSSSQSRRAPRLLDPAVMSTFITVRTVGASLPAPSVGPLISSRRRRCSRAAAAQLSWTGPGSPLSDVSLPRSVYYARACLEASAVRPIKGLKLVFAPQESWPFALARVHRVVLIAWPPALSLVLQRV